MGSRHEPWDSTYPTLLEVPRQPTSQATPQPNWGLPTETHLLPLPSEAYYVHQANDLWFVTLRATGAFVYIGPGPVNVSVSPAPF